MNSIIDTTCPRFDALPIDAIDVDEAPHQPYERRGCEPVDAFATFDDDEEKYPPWICAFLLVVYCSIFWIGVVTFGNWVWTGISSLFA